MLYSCKVVSRADYILSLHAGRISFFGCPNAYENFSKDKSHISPKRDSVAKTGNNERKGSKDPYEMVHSSPKALVRHHQVTADVAEPHGMDGDESCAEAAGDVVLTADVADKTGEKGEVVAREESGMVAGEKSEMNEEDYARHDRVEEEGEEGDKEEEEEGRAVGSLDASVYW